MLKKQSLKPDANQVKLDIGLNGMYSFAENFYYFLERLSCHDRINDSVSIMTIANDIFCQFCLDKLDDDTMVATAMRKFYECLALTRKKQDAVIQKIKREKTVN